MARTGKIITESTKTFAKQNLTRQTLNNGMNPLKYVQIYICVEYPTYIRLHMIIRMKFKSIQDVSTAKSSNLYGYILARRHNNIFLHPERKTHDIVTKWRKFVDHGKNDRHNTRIIKNYTYKRTNKCKIRNVDQ